MGFRLRIAGKLAVAYGLFLAPIAFLGVQVVADKAASIGFAQKELQGVLYVRELLEVQRLAVRGGDPGPLADRVAANEARRGDGLGTAEPAQALRAALAAGDAVGAAQAAAEAIGRAADGSNLTLDPDLDSYYTQDALTVKLPAAVAGVAGLAAAAGRDLSPAAQVAQAVRAGALQPILDGLAGDVASAVRGNPSGTVAPALGAKLEAVTAAAGGFLAAVSGQGGGVSVPEGGARLLDALAALGEADAAQLEQLLRARIAGLRLAQATSAGVAAALFLAAVVYVVAVIQRGVVSPLRQLTASMGRLAAQDLSVQVPQPDRADEVGDIARAVQVFRDSMAEGAAAAAAQREIRAAKDRRQAAMDRQTADFGTVIAGVLQRLTASAEAMSATAGDMTEVTRATLSRVGATADGAAEAARNLAAVAAATAELSASVDEIGRQVTDTEAATRLAVERAGTSQRSFGQMSELGAHIGGVGRSISAIAARTNLLALNATIEAARAGEAGKGFAVVATEVKALATQTVQATSEIGDKVAGIDAATRQTEAAIAAVTAAIARVDGIAAAIGHAVSQQGLATREIAQTVQAVAATGEQTAGAMAALTATSARSDEMGQTILDAAQTLGEVAGTLRLEVNAFLQAMAEGDARGRSYERIAGGDAPAVLLAPDGREIPARLRDISRGGAALACRWAEVPGTAVRLRLAGLAQPLPARLVRHGDGTVGLAFAQDTAVLALLDPFIAALASGPAARAA